MAERPVVLITGAAGAVGAAIRPRLDEAYTVVGLDREGAHIPVDLTDDASVDAALARVEAEHGRRIASVIHLAAYFDFTGEEHPLYRRLNVEGTERLLRALQRLEVEQFVYPSTMLVHAPGQPGERIDEDRHCAPRWVYPRSKLEAEQALAAAHGTIPYVVLRLAGQYDEETVVPTLAHQIARIFERVPEGHLYPGDTAAGQSMLHSADLAEAVRLTVDRRADLAREGDVTLLIGEPEPMSYAELQRAIGLGLHELPWPTVRPPAAVAKLGAAVEQALSPLVPEALGGGRETFVRPFMVDGASDHYALDVGRAERLLGWTPRHSLRETLPSILAALRRDPPAWYDRNKVDPPKRWPNPT